MNKDKIKKLVLDILFKYQGIVVLLILLDQITKIIALNYFYIDKNSSIEIFGLDWLQFKFVFNSGAAFSSFEGNQLLLAIVSIVASLVIEYVVIFKKSKDKILNTILLFILAGAFANGIDRWLAVFPDVTGYKGVVDFIYVSWFANFNVADIYVTLGCIAMMIYFFFFEEKFKKKNEKKEVNAHE